MAKPLRSHATELSDQDAASAVVAAIQKLYPFVTASQARDAADAVLSELRARGISVVRRPVLNRRSIRP
jgi:hypothetical protein